ncbi:uncharacterized protein FOMMEDRAFT_152734 [Fomitiporia mediterranea MF3/22]|uniref:uncharacterized protein n=1 Tax=Fomitiporia mediterranea (strain MF3/22) TaxID=694068 RepID=UPI00044092A3|nr:uncharacterized protein FOMMEDRAFT_152734 [Fomitiporia mediterranea MF3/22]EJD05425.1 hypothetical protein FOMMEDRAFT_152734 [Fomitiporia mediterranea MF3/22]
MSHNSHRRQRKKEYRSDASDPDRHMSTTPGNRRSGSTYHHWPRQNPDDVVPITRFVSIDELAAKHSDPAVRREWEEYRATEQGRGSQDRLRLPGTERDHAAEKKRNEEVWDRNKQRQESTVKDMKKVIKEVFEDKDEYGLQDDTVSGICSNMVDEVGDLHHASFDFESKIKAKETAFCNLLVDRLDGKINNEGTEKELRQRCRAKKTEIRGMFQ